jgi:hypothetical protein
MVLLWENLSENKTMVLFQGGLIYGKPRYNHVRTKYVVKPLRRYWSLNYVTWQARIQKI